MGPELSKRVPMEWSPERKSSPGCGQTSFEKENEVWRRPGCIRVRLVDLREQTAGDVSKLTSNLTIYLWRPVICAWACSLLSSWCLSRSLNAFEAE
jgi:hypothetical protein